MAVESAEPKTRERLPSQRDRDLFTLARALGCEPVEVTPPWEDGTGDGAPMYLIDFSKAGPEESNQRGSDGSWEPVEETPEERARRMREGLAAIAEYEAEFGTFTADEKAWARGVMASLGVGVEG